MKKNKLLITLLVLSIVLPTNVFANTFVNGDKEYKITKADAACTQYTYVESGDDATVMYVDIANNQPWLLLPNNTCKEITLEDVIDIQDKYNYRTYNVDFETDGTATIYSTKEYRFITDGLIKSTTYDQEKVYYVKNGDTFDEVETSKEEDLNLYYEIKYFRPAKYDATANQTYYYSESSQEPFEIVSDPANAEIDALYVISDKDQVVFEEKKTLDNKLYTTLQQVNYYSLEVYATPDEKTFYFIAFMDDTASSINVYDESGNLLYEGITAFTPALNELHIVYKDNKVYIYDLNKKLLHETEMFESILYELKQANNVSLLYSNNDDIYFLSSETIVDSTQSPNTSDGIATTIIITIIAGLSLIGLITYQTKTKKQN